MLTAFGWCPKESRFRVGVSAADAQACYGVIHQRVRHEIALGLAVLVPSANDEDTLGWKRVPHKCYVFQPSALSPSSLR